MRDGWREVRISDIAEIQQGKTLATTEMRGGDSPVYGANGVIGWHSRGHYSHEVVALGCRGSCGTVHTAPPGAWLANNVMAIWPKASESVSVRFLKLVLEQADFVSSGVISGQVQPQITRQSLAPFMVWLPPPAEQGRIVELVGALDRTLALARTVVERASRAWVTWASDCWAVADHEAPLGSLAHSVTGATPRTGNRAFWEPAEVPFFTPGDLDGSPILTHSARRLSTTGAATVRLLGTPSVAQVCIGATYGKVAVLGVPACTNQQINSLTGLDEVDAVSVMAMLATPAGQNRLRAVAGITTMPIVKKSSWQSMEIRWPLRPVRESLHGIVIGLATVSAEAKREVLALTTLRATLLGGLLSGDHEIPVSFDRFLDSAA